MAGLYIHTAEDGDITNYSFCDQKVGIIMDRYRLLYPWYYCCKKALILPAVCIIHCCFCSVGLAFCQNSSFYRIKNYLPWLIVIKEQEYINFKTWCCLLRYHVDVCTLLRSIRWWHKYTIKHKNHLCPLSLSNQGNYTPWNRIYFHM